MAWLKDKDAGWHSAFAGYMGCFATVIMSAIAISVSVYFAIHPYDQKNPPFLGMSAAFWSWMVRWGPPMICGACFVITFRLKSVISRLIPEELNTLRQRLKFQQIRISYLQDEAANEDFKQKTAKLQETPDSDEIRRRHEEIEALNLAIRNLTNESATQKGYIQQYEERIKTVTTEKSALYAEKEALKATLNELTGRKQQSEAQSAPQPQVTSEPLKTTENPFYFDPERKAFSHTWNDQLVTIHIANNSPGLILAIINEGPAAIGSCAVQIAKAEDWSQRHRLFRTHNDYAPVAVFSVPGLDAESRSGNQWFLKPNGTFLSVGQGNGGLPAWPNNDPSPFQIWKIMLILSFNSNPDAKVKGIALSPVVVLVYWHREEHKMTITPYPQKQNAPASA